jgi:hypothetical protein
VDEAQQGPAVVAPAPTNDQQPMSRGEEAARWLREHGGTFGNAALKHGVSSAAVYQHWRRLFGDEQTRPRADTPYEPRPERTKALLCSEGISSLEKVSKRFTWHTYERTQRSTAMIGDQPKPCWEHLFKCTVTGAVRRWGIE